MGTKASLHNFLESKPLRILLGAQKFIMVASTLLLLVILGIVVILRYTVHKDFFGYDEIAIMGAYYMYFIGASYAMYDGTHVKADIIVNYFPEKIRYILKAVAGTIQTLLSIYMTYLAYKLVSHSIEVHQITASYSLPYAIPQTAVLIGIALMTFYMGIYTIMDICDCAEKLKG